MPKAGKSAAGKGSAKAGNLMPFSKNGATTSRSGPPKATAGKGSGLIAKAKAAK